MAKRSFWTCIYFIQAEVSPFLVKIGQAVRPHNRLMMLQIGSPVNLRLIWYVRAHKSAEALFHAAFADQRERGEWFRAHPNLRKFVEEGKSSKQFVLTPELLARLGELATCQIEMGPTIQAYQTLYRTEPLGRRRGNLVKKACQTDHEILEIRAD